MRAPTASELLAVWERCATQTPAERAVELLALASPDARVDELASLTVGERDRRLLELRERLFGPELSGTGACGRCGELVEFSVRTGDLRPEASPEPAETLALTYDGYDLRFRVPTSADLAAISRERNPESARLRLLERCVLTIVRGDEEAPAAALPDEAAEALAARMAEADPQADVELALTCPGCGETWSATFDAGSFLWSDVDLWTRQTLRDVHVLAEAYGWTESEVLALGPRRLLYLELAGG